MKVSFDPSELELAEIETWLIEEEKQTREGFYCNWSTIVGAHAKKQLAIIKANNKTVGFITWRLSEIVATIDLAEIKPDHRKKGLAKILLEHLFNYFSTKGIMIVDLMCSPEESEDAWKKMGFVEFPDEDIYNGSDGRNKELYQIIVPAMYLVPDCTMEHIALWDVTTHGWSNQDPRWIWPAIFKPGTRKLIKPIIHPAHGDWKLQWRNAAHLYDECRAKVFQNRNAWIGKYLIIKELPLKVQMSV